MTSDSQQEKEALRREAGRRRKRAAAEAGEDAAEALRDRFEAHIAPSGRVAVSGYWPIGSEIDPRPILKALDRDGHPIGLPVVLSLGEPLQFRAWRPGDTLEKAGFGLQEPVPSRPEILPGLLLVPLLAFDRRGYRLGYGGGFYDRTLAKLRAADPHLMAIGLAYAGQETERVPTESTDQPLDWILTETEAIEVAAPCACSSAATS